jgi:hypothetical protein
MMRDESARHRPSDRAGITKDCDLINATLWQTIESIVNYLVA